MKKTILTAVLVAVATAAQAKFSTRTDLSAGTSRDLANGVIYDVKADLSLSANPGESALRVNNKDVVAINIAKGATLTVTGGNAAGATGEAARAGESPLIVTVPLPPPSDCSATGSRQHTGGSSATPFVTVTDETIRSSTAAAFAITRFSA